MGFESERIWVVWFENTSAEAGHLSGGSRIGNG